MSSEIKVSNVKALDGTAGISIADSTGRVSFTETNPSLTLETNTTFPAGHVIQVKGNRSNYDWSSVGHGNVFEITWCKVTMTVKQTGSMFRVNGRFVVDDTNSGTFGLGMGVKYAVNGGSNVTAILAPAHEQYGGQGNDTYMLGHLDRLIHNDTSMTDSTSEIVPTSGLINPTAGDTIVWTMTCRFNNSNGTNYRGSDQTNALPYFNTEMVVMEISK